MADGVLPRYFEQDRVKRARQAVAGYSSAPSGDMGGDAAGGTAPAPAPSGPKAPTATGGSGFVNFGQYFGANAPAVQETVTKNIDAASSTKAMRAPQGAPGLSTFGTVDFGKTPSASTMAQRQAAGPSVGAGYDRAIAQTQEQMAGLQGLTEPGSYGTGTAAPSAFDAMLGGGLQQREAKTRLGQMEQQLGSQREAQTAYTQQQQAQADAERQARQAAEWQSWWDNERRRSEYAEQQRKAEEDKSFWDYFKIGSLR